MKRFGLLVLSLIFVMACAFGCGSLDVSETNRVTSVRVSRTVFGSLTLTGYVFGYGVNAEDTAEPLKEMYDFLDDFDAKVSTKNTSSLIYKFNQNIGGQPQTDGSVKYEIDLHAYNMLSKAAQLNQITDGYFDPTVYPLMKLWGLRTDEWNNPALHFNLPLPNEVTEALRHCGLDKIELSQETGLDGVVRYYVAKSDTEVMIDLGGQAKGYAADRLHEIIIKYPQLCAANISLSGNVYMLGKFPNAVKKGDVYYKKGESDFISGVIDPDPSYAMLQIPLVGFDVNAAQGMSVVTSGDYERRFYWVDGRYYTGGATTELSKIAYFCHIIDPKTGYPCNLETVYNDGTDPYRNASVGKLSSATVLHPSSEIADVYATALLLMGMDQAIAFLERQSLQGFLVGCDGYYANLINNKIDTNKKKYSFTSHSYLKAVEGYSI